MFDELKKKLENLNSILKDKNKGLDRNNIKEYLIKNDIATIKKSKKLNEQELRAVSCDKGVVAVDGSINNFGGLYPHYISLIRAVALCTKGYKAEYEDIYTPLLEENMTQDEDAIKRRATMSKMEIKAAMDAINNCEANIIFMDGSLLHYKIDCPYEWDELKKSALYKNKIIVGITEEVKTKDIGEILIKDGQLYDEFIYDREILFNMLSEGEYLYLKKEIKTRKKDSGIKSFYARFSDDPQAIGIDFLKEQEAVSEGILSLIYTLTFSKSRGIPYLIDLVDVETKVTDEKLKALIDGYLDKEVVEVYFNPKRNKRGY
ncbi:MULTISPECIES: DNA double-strand break repair nuclease NurA [Caloramator]|uniref:NurA domain-containing protein n=1 Tax=Caloramator proteoclasticus DSM 10124 TaxID=1121262 RepID=A0A1M4ZQX0_9CLOT|nr:MULTISPECIES: DNA double-strand break repair nuclease NurA [Caloramator]SHF20394.1 NurA domain-containing protein [Caloramator proteoclasticus DSM 10124]